MLKVILNQEEEKNKGRLNRSEWKKEDASGAPLHHAAKHGHDEVIKLLVQAGADINSYEGKRGEAVFLCYLPTTHV